MTKRNLKKVAAVLTVSMLASMAACAGDDTAETTGAAETQAASAAEGSQAESGQTESGGYGGKFGRFYATDDRCAGGCADK